MKIGGDVYLVSIGMVCGEEEVLSLRQREKTALQNELDLYLVALECNGTFILTSPLETAVFPFFKDIFSLFIRSLRRDSSLSPDTGFLL